MLSGERKSVFYNLKLSDPLNGTKNSIFLSCNTLMIMSATTIRSRVHESELVVGSRGTKYAIISRNDLQSWIIENKDV